MNAGYLTIIIDILAIASGLTMTVFMILSFLKYRNPYFGLFTLAYTGTGIMEITLVLKYSFNCEDTLLFILIEMLCILCIIESITWLVIKLFYEKIHMLLKVIIIIAGVLPPVTYILAKVFYHDLLYPQYFISYLFFYGMLGVACILFGLNYRKIDPSAYRKFSILFWLLLLVFIAIFVVQRVWNLGFNPLSYFYFLWSVLLIWFSWKHILSNGLNKLFHVQTSFAKRYNITKREEEIIELIIQGHKNIKIGEQLFISEKTVTNHLYNIYKKLGISSRFELICLFKQ